MDSLKTLADAIALYANSSPVINSHVLAKLQSTLKIYVLPSFQISPRSLKDLPRCFHKLPLKDFLLRAEKHFEYAITQAKAEGKNLGTLKNHRSGFNRFMRYLRAQDWYIEVIEVIEPPRDAPKIQVGICIEDLHRGRRAYHEQVYVVKKEELSQKLIQQINFLHKFLTAKYLPSRPSGSLIAESTWQSYEKYILSFLGWLKNIVGFSLEDLDLMLLTDMHLLKEYISWHINERNNSYRTPMGACFAALNVAKCFCRKPDGSATQLTNYSDIAEVNAIRKEISILQNYGKGHRRTSSKEALAEKLLSMEQCQEVVKHLHARCSERDSHGGRRSIDAICNSWQDYLIIAILTYTPVRQREIRELEIGKNLFREEDGWWVKLGPEGHKTGRKRGRGREYPLFAGPAKKQLTQDLDRYINEIRPQVVLRVKDAQGNVCEEKHNFLFFGRGCAQSSDSKGLPLIHSKCHLTQLVPRVMVSATAVLYGAENVKCTSAHDFRRIFASWLIKFGNSEDWAVYAEVMGTSVKQLLDTYSQLESKDTTGKADATFARIAARQQEFNKFNQKK